MDAIEYDATVRPDHERATGYMAVSTTRYAGDVTITGWPWTGYGDTPEEAISALERRLRELHQAVCQPRGIVYVLGKKGIWS